MNSKPDNSNGTQQSRSRIETIRSWFASADASSLHDHPNPDAYRAITADVREQSLNRHDKKLHDLSDLQTRLRIKVFLCVTSVLVLLSIAAWVIHNRLPDYDQTAPQSLATWIEQQKMLRQVQQVQQWLQEGKAESDLPPPENIEDVQAWLDQIELNPDIQKLDPDETTGEPGFVPFQCSPVPISCPASDVPSGAGESRLELSYLVRNAKTMLVNNGDCDEAVNLMGEYESLFGWRKSEAITKAQTELSVARCFMNKEDTESAHTHYQRTFCASVADPNPDQAMSALYGMARIAWLDKDSGMLNNHVQCSESLLDYHLQDDPDVDTLYNYITLSLMHYEFLDDTREAIRLEEKALTAARVLATSAEAEEREEHLGLMLTLQMNLMEGYLTIGESEPMGRLYAELKSNPLLEDGDRLVALGLLVMQDLIDGNNQSAKDTMNNIIARYQTLAEFTTIWSWSAFDRWQIKTKSNRTEAIDTMIRELRLALAADRPPDSMQKLSKVLLSIGAG